MSGNGDKHARKPSGDVLGPCGNPHRLGLPKRSPNVARMLEQFVTQHGGSRPIHSVLVANNGLGAVKFMRSVRSWASQALGNPRAIAFLAMATPNDMLVSAEHISLADQFVEVPGGSNNNNYANVSLIVQIAQRAGVDAVWPGWGHASENPELPTALEERGIIFLGPHAPAMAALGDKIGSTILAQAASVPTLPWSGSGVMMAYADCGGVLPEEIYAKACIADVEQAVEACARIGYPIMLKASWGGGGKGIRKVASEAEVRSVFRQVAGEVPGSPIFAMKLAPVSRHLEVQLLCDEHGNVASLMSRDCSVQRRHQKIVEEGPVTGVPQETLVSMEKCARSLARSVGYVGVATMEFLYCVEEGGYYFLELNPRLQVEHPVTEGITGVNLPACQVLVGMGVPLWRIPSVRALYCMDPEGDTPFDLETTPQKPADGHVVAVRIIAEDAAAGFKPTAGRIDELFFRPTPEVWGYFSVKSGGAIHEYSDSQFGHLFAHGATRAAALRSLVVALRDVVVRGEVRTIVDYALDMLQSPDFVNSEVHTGWLDSRIAQKVCAAPPAWHLAVIAGAVVRAHEAFSSQSTEYLSHLAKGQLPPASVSLTRLKETMIIGESKYCVDVVRRAPTAYCVTLNGSSVDVTTRKMADGRFLLQVDGESHVVHVEEEPAGTRLTLGASTLLLAKEADLSRLITSSPGKLIRFLVTSGAHLAQHQPYAEVEVMKMLMLLLAPAAGTVRFCVSEGTTLSGGQDIGRLEMDDPLAVVHAERFIKGFPELGPPVLPSARPDHRLQTALAAAHHILAGYVQPVERVAADVVGCLDAPTLALGQWTDEIAVVRSRLPQSLVHQLDQVTIAHEDLVEQVLMPTERVATTPGAATLTPSSVLGPTPEFPAAQLLHVMERATEATEASERNALTACLTGLKTVAQCHEHGREAYARSVVKELLDSFLDVEEAFMLGGTEGPCTEQEAIDAMRKVRAPAAVLDAVVSHQALAYKADLVARLLAALVLPAPTHYRPHLRRLAALGGTVGGAGELAARAAALLEHSLLADLRVVVARALSGLDMFASGHSDSGTGVPMTTAVPEGSTKAPSPVRRSGPTTMEGLFSGLPAFLITPSSAGITAGGVGSPPSGLQWPGAGSSSSPPFTVTRVSTMVVENKMDMLVSVPAAVEDALASLLVEDALDGPLRARAALTWVRRLYHPFLLCQPRLQLIHLPSWCSSPISPVLGRRTVPGGGQLATMLEEGGQVDGGDAVLAQVVLMAWLYDTPGLANSEVARARVGAALLLPSLAALQVALEGPLAAGLAALGLSSASPGTLHVVLTGQGGDHGDLALALGQGDSGTGGVPVAETPIGSPDLESLTEAQAGFQTAVSGAVSRATRALRAVGFDSVGFLASSFTGLLPLRMGYEWQQASEQAEGLLDVGGCFRRNRFMSQVDVPSVQTLELTRLAPYSTLHHTPSRNRQYQLYTATERPDARSYPTRRVFVRGVVRQLSSPALLAASYSGNAAAVVIAALDEVETALASALHEVARLQQQQTGPGHAAGAGPVDWTHLFCHVLPALPLAPGGISVSLGTPQVASSAAEYDSKVAAALRVGAAGLVARHAAALRAAAVACIELRLRGPGRSPAWRVLISMPTGHEHGEQHVGVYREALSTSSGPPSAPSSPLQAPVLVYACASAHQLGVPGGSVSHQHEAVVGQPLLGPYPHLQPLQQRRLAARRHNVTYCYDFPTVFETALRDIWHARAVAGEPNSEVPTAGRLVEAEELVLAAWAEGHVCTGREYRGPCPLVRVERQGGLNDCGMVVWLLTLRTPECPQGRQVVAVANDLTFQSGAFSPREDAVFRGACELALAERLPLLYLAANSGARVGLAMEVRDRLHVAWCDPEDPEKGVAYLYLTDTDYRTLQALGAKNGSEVVHCRAHSGPDGTRHWVLEDVVGAEDGLGVECLSGSGATASAFNRAFREGYTISLVSGRTVGIGAYLVRLGRRCVQRADQPIILTGFAALNKLLGRPVYSSHMQLGGPRVMGANGVSHHVVADDLEGCRTLLSLLAFCPPLLVAPGSVAAPQHPTLLSADPVDRLLGYVPGLGEKLDPRAAVAGRTLPGAAGSDSWQGGLFDKGTWVESHSGWACTVVTGRARLGGLPVGVVAVETAIVTRYNPADPGQPDSTETHTAQAGQVWYPDSASKTAAAIEEFNLEGLPLLILANWRGFSGGQRDLFDGVLQAGSLIVEALRTYRQPVTVYIPASAELRGGAWVVVDSQISTEGCIEMFADPGARGGVLEPEGVVEIKFRTPDLIKLMHRTDPVICAAKAELVAAGVGLGSNQANFPVSSSGVHDGGQLSPEARIKARERQLLPMYQQVARAFADMHDTPVRMLAKGVLDGIVPWGMARTFLAGRLRRRLVEMQLAAHVAATDPSVTRQSGLARIRGWHAAWQESNWSAVAAEPSSPNGLGHDGAALQSELDRLGGGSVSKHSSPTSHRASHGATAWSLASAAATGAPAGAVESEPKGAGGELAVMMEKDASFLEWAESSAGRAALAGELRLLRTQAATSMTAQVLASPEGREGLLTALAGAVAADPGLANKLHALLAAPTGR